MDLFMYKVFLMHNAIEDQVRVGRKHENCNPLAPLVAWLKDQRDMSLDAVLTSDHREHLGQHAEKMGRKGM